MNSRTAQQVLKDLFKECFYIRYSEKELIWLFDGKYYKTQRKRNSNMEVNIIFAAAGVVPLFVPGVNVVWAAGIAVALIAADVFFKDDIKEAWNSLD